LILRAAPLGRGVPGSTDTGEKVAANALDLEESNRLPMAEALARPRNPRLLISV
jgi:hypothetical protein